MPENILENIQAAPIIDGSTVTFVWKGKKPPQLVGDFTDWETGTTLSPVKAGRNLMKIWMND
jgi:hypothetical protein